MNKSPRNVIWLGITSLLTDLSSEMIFPVLPIFLKGVLGVPMSVVGLIEGVAEAAASLTKYFSGWLSDRIKKRKFLTWIGYTLSAISKPFFIFTTGWGQVLFVRVVDRLGKGIRTSPRDALISASVEEKERGKYFGLHRTLDTVGAFLGALIAAFLLWQMKGDLEGSIRLIFLLAAVPGIFAIILLWVFVKEAAFQKGEKEKTVSRGIFQIKDLGVGFQKFLIVLFLFGLINFSYAFYLLRGEKFLPLALLPLLYLIYNAFYALSAYPAGRLSDRFGRIPVLVFGFLLLALVNFAFAISSHPFFLPFLIFYFFVIFAVYGGFISIVDGVLRAFVADLVEEKKQGQAFGVYHAIFGFSVLPANLIGGFLWDFISPAAPFIMGAAISGILAIFFPLLFRRHFSKTSQTGAEFFKGYR